MGLRAIGGEQVLLCHVTYEPGTTVGRHSHETAEQVMWIIDGSVTMTIDLPQAPEWAKPIVAAALKLDWERNRP